MTHSVEFINSVRRCATAGLSTQQAAESLGATRNAIIGLAHRNGIKFSGMSRRGPRHQVPTPKTKPASTMLATHVVSVSTNAWKVKPPGPRCSWAGCGHDALLGDMFCRGHARMPLMGPR